jgi:uncharacterized protein
MFKINIHNLKDGEHTYKFAAYPKDFDFEKTEFEIIDDININAVLYKAGSQISVKIELKGKFKFECDRCLDDYVYDFNTTFNIIYKYVFKGLQDEEFNDDEDIKFIQPNTVFIDLKEDIREFILLSVPMRKAPDDINGICSYCNKNVKEIFKIKHQTEINPVWEKLIKAKKI